MSDRKMGLKIIKTGVAGHPEPGNYNLSCEENDTVLAALIRLRSTVEPTLAFRYSCRSGRCGLCAIKVNGNPTLGCMTRVKEGDVIEPLDGMPVIRDLVIDREAVLEQVIMHELYIPENSPVGREFIFHGSAAWKNLSLCLECLGCLSACPMYRSGNNSFGGPFLFVKLAQLLYDPRDRTDRRAQARRLGIERCRECGRCRCLNGVGIYKNAIRPLLST